MPLFVGFGKKGANLCEEVHVMRGQMMSNHKGYSMCGGPCGYSGMRSFLTKEERKERLGEYIQELKKETQAAEESLNELSE